MNSSDSNVHTTQIEANILNSKSWDTIQDTTLPWNTFDEYEHNIYQHERQMSQELRPVFNSLIIR